MSKYRTMPSTTEQSKLLRAFRRGATGFLSFGHSVSVMRYNESESDIVRDMNPVSNDVLRALLHIIKELPGEKRRELRDKLLQSEE